MTYRKRKKKPPDPKHPSFVSPLAPSLPVGLPFPMLGFWFRAPAFPPRCSFVASGSSAVSISPRVCFPLQSGLGIQSKFGWVSLLPFGGPRSALAVCSWQDWPLCPGRWTLLSSSTRRPLLSAGIRRPLVQFVLALVRARVLFSLEAPRSALVATWCHNWQAPSVGIASCSSIVLSLNQVCSFLPLLFIIVLMESLWNSYSKTLHSIIPHSCVRWTGVPRLPWPWVSLCLIWSVGLCLNDFKMDILAFNDFTVGASVSIFRLFLSNLYCLGITTLLYWPTWMMCSLVPAHGKFFDYHYWIAVTSSHYALRMLFVLSSWYLRNFHVDLWGSWVFLACFHLDQCIYVIGLHLWMLVLQCSVFWLYLAWVAVCIAYSGVFSRSSLSWICHPMFLSIVATMVIGCCAQMQGYLAWLPTGIILMTLNSCRTEAWFMLNLYCGWLVTYMLDFFSSITAAWVVIAEVWGPPLFWLSLPLDRLTALRQEPLWSRFCWQLLAFQIGRDEVTGKSLFVDEDLLSETSLVIYFEVSRGGGRVACWFLVQVLGLSALGCCGGQSQLGDCINSPSAPGSSDVSIPFLFSCPITTYWIFDVMINFPPQMALQVLVVVDRIQCIDNHSVSYISGYCTPSVISCIFSVIRTLEQHLCVLGIARRGLGLCLLALAMHLWILRPAHYGCCFDRYIVVRQFYQLQKHAMLISTTVVHNLLTLCVSFCFATLLVTNYILTVFK